MSPRENRPEGSAGAREPGPDHGLEIAAIAHDLNQMLTVIAGRIGLLRTFSLDEAVSRHLAAVDLACRDASALVGRLVGEDGGGEEGGQDVGAPRCEVAREAAAAADLALGAESGVEVVIAGDGTWPAAVPGQVVREVLVNLLLNAREAMGGRGRVAISAATDGSTLRLRVRDEGPGIAPGLKDRLFQRGVSSSGKDDRGIGLAGCRLLLRRWGGELNLEDHDGPGAVFVLELPCGDETTAGADAAAPAAAGAPGARDREVDRERLAVLVVDDEAAVRDMLAEVLPALGCRVTSAGNVASALEIFRPSAFTVAMVDETLPDGSGRELARLLRRDDPCLSVVLMSGWGKALPEAGDLPPEVDFAVRKPLEFPRLQRMLVDAVRLGAGRRAGGDSPS